MQLACSNHSVLRQPSFLLVFKAIFTLYWIAFTSARKSHRAGLLFTHKSGDFGAISQCSGSKLHRADF